MNSQQYFLLGVAITASASHAKSHAPADGGPLLSDPGQAEQDLHLFG
ncbi:hypothetical protein [Microvirga yunnanensis]|nr:hypothetical protein [Microvirga sp. HBU65207]